MTHEAIQAQQSRAEVKFPGGSQVALWEIMFGLEENRLKSRAGEGIEENMGLFMKSETATNHDSSKNGYQTFQYLNKLKDLKDISQ